MFKVFLLAALASLCRGGTELEPAEDDKTQKLHQGAAFWYEVLEQRLDNLQLTLFKLFTSLEKAEQTRLEGQRAMLEGQRAILEQLQNGIKVQTVNQESFQIIEDCLQVTVSGRYLLRSPGSSKIYAVVCEAESFGGGWIVIQQRINGTVDFNRDWEAYKNGFGSIGLANEFWLGLEKLYQLINNDSFELAVELKNESGGYGYVLYYNFIIAGKDDHYRLSRNFRINKGSIDGQMQILNNETFSTYDKDNDKSDDHCGAKYKSGWWFYRCNQTNLNGPYKKDPATGRGIFWNGFTDAATYSRMMIRRM